MVHTTGITLLLADKAAALTLAALSSKSKGYHTSIDLLPQKTWSKEKARQV